MATVPAVSIRKLLVWGKSYSSSSVCCIGTELGSLRDAMPPNMYVLSCLVFIDVGLCVAISDSFSISFPNERGAIKNLGSFFYSSFDYLANDLNTSVFFAHPRIVSNRLFNDMGVGRASRRMG